MPHSTAQPRYIPLPEADELPEEQLVLICARMPDAPADEAAAVDKLAKDPMVLNLEQLASELETAVAAAGVGEYDGWDYGPEPNGTTLYRLFLYGPDADELCEAVLPIVRRYGLPPGS